MPILTFMWLLLLVILLRTIKATFVHSFNQSAVCPMQYPQPLPKQVVHRRRASASPFNFQYLLIF